MTGTTARGTPVRDTAIRGSADRQTSDQGSRPDTDLVTTGDQRRLWCGDCRDTQVFEEVHLEVQAASEFLDLLCTACGAAYFADFSVDADLPTGAGQQSLVS